MARRIAKPTVGEPVNFTRKELTAINGALGYAIRDRLTAIDGFDKGLDREAKAEADRFEAIRAKIQKILYYGSELPDSAVDSYLPELDATRTS